MTEIPEGSYRTERDFAGELRVPATMLYGAQTHRAVETFPISNLRFPRRFIRILGTIKREAAEVNHELGLLDANLKDAITSAAREVANGDLDQHFVVDVFQTGSGTNTNMNANEVIANRANQVLGGALGSKSPVHPNDHVNRGQSSNDVIPTAIHLSALNSIEKDLLPGLRKLQSALEEKSREFDGVVKTGRTHLQDATPMRLGQEFEGYAGQIERGMTRLRQAQEGLSEVALGGTAVGTGINTHPEFAARVCARLSEHLAVEIHETRNHFQAQSSLDGVVFASGALKAIAVSLLKIANDVRWMSSGPRAGLGEITLPETSLSSSIMPGKSNPVIAESVCQVAAKVIGNDATITLGGQYGNFEINVMMPIMAYSLLESIEILSTATTNFADRCVTGIRPTGYGPVSVERSLMMATALAPVIGYDKAAEISKEAHDSGRTIREVARQMADLSDEDLNFLLDARRTTENRRASR
jgi:fumarate hydratase, class II